jgi:hypothetical protein
MAHKETDKRMSSSDSVIDEDYSFYIHIQWWQVLITIILIVALIYLIKRRRVV